MERAVKLTIKDRLIVPNILPQQGGLVSQRVCKDIRSKIQITQDEIKRFNIRDTVLPSGAKGVDWDTQKTEVDENGLERKVPIEGLEIDIVFTTAELKTLAEAVAKLDKSGRVNQENLDTCEKFLDPLSNPAA